MPFYEGPVGSRSTPAILCGSRIRGIYADLISYFHWTVRQLFLHTLNRFPYVWCFIRGATPQFCRFTRLLKSVLHQVTSTLRTPCRRFIVKVAWSECFQRIQQVDDQFSSRREGKKEQNISRNRYKNIVPFDHTRLVLVSIIHTSTTAITVERLHDRSR